jgi:CheY-like chemotaxis protein
MKPVRLNDAVRDTIQLLGRIIPKHIEMSADLASDLPGVRGDAVQLEQIIMNLCVNARDAMPDGGKLSLKTQLRDVGDKQLPQGVLSPDNRFVVLSVEDTGCGMHMELRDRIFEPFFTTKGTGEGTGLGLALTYGIVRTHGGFIEVASEPGKGAKFEIFLPPIAGPKPVRAETAPAAAVQGHGELILLIDDEPVVREVAETVLEQLGYRVIAAKGGAEGLEIYRERGAEIDLVLLDLMMPRMRGEKVFAKMREMNPDVQVVISTGNPDLIDRFPELQEHAAGFANKPYRMGDLSRALENALNKS